MAMSRARSQVSELRLSWGSTKPLRAYFTDLLALAKRDMKPLHPIVATKKEFAAAQRIGAKIGQAELDRAELTLWASGTNTTST